LDLPHWLVIVALLGLGATAGPVQPINAELAVEVSYPADETSIEAVQQLCGNLFSALLVPICERAARLDFDVLPSVLNQRSGMPAACGSGPSRILQSARWTVCSSLRFLRNS